MLSVRLYEDPISCVGPIHLFQDFRALGSGERKTIYVDRDAPLTVGAWYVTGWSATGVGLSRKQCDLNGTFSPSAEAYRLIYSTDEQEEKCGIDASVLEGVDWRPVGANVLTLRASNVAFSQSGPWCSPLPKEG